MQQTPTHLADWIIILPVIATLMGAALLLMLRDVKRWQAALALLIVLGVLVSDTALFFRVLQGGPMSMTMGHWLPPFGISFTADAMSAGFALVAALVTLIVLVYAQMDRAGSDDRDGFYPLVLLLLAGVSGAFLTGDLFNLYVWFEVMLIASFGLLVLGGTGAEIDGAVKYGFLNFLATTFFLAALGLLYGLIGTLNMADIALSAPKANPAALASVAALFLLAFGMKAAAFPVNAWLPASYHTPPAAISALFGSLLTKVGVYALLRTLVVLLPGTHQFLAELIAALAILTLVLAPMGAIAETNLRRAIGFLVIGGIGAVIAGLVLTSVQGLAGAIMYVLHAMLSLAGLYLVAGLVENTTGETDTRLMGGVYAANSLLSTLFLILVLTISGVPPFLGFWPKLLLLGAGADFSGIVSRGGIVDYGALALVVALLLNAILTLIAGTRLWAHIFWRAGREGVFSEQPNDRLRPLTPRENGYGMVAASVLVAIIVVAGLWPNILFEAAHVAASDLINPQRYVAAVGLGGAP
ncbi:MAG TPA: proton-conducting transporter membrane subunit [Arsenicitalea sp.]|jgi:multicomponent Na+:H+ antiporter subunit D|nr:proton-conducting transporter membrane subunit [Arsenicitalea sp.]